MLISMAVKSSAATLPWFWVVEFLSSFKDIDTSLLNELILRTPDILDPLAKNARERVALRCLESLFLSIPSRDDSPPNSKIEFDLSENCEKVIQYMDCEIPVLSSNLRMFGTLESFIKHKLASLPTFALQQLKEKISEGSWSFSESSKQSSPLLCGDDGGSHAARQDLARSIPETSNEILPEDASHGDSLPLKRDMNELVFENPVDPHHEEQVQTDNVEDFNPKAKTLKYDSCCNVDELLEEPSEELDSGFSKNNEANDVSHAARQDLARSIPETSIEILPEDASHRDSLPLKRDRNELVFENPAEHRHEEQVQTDNVEDLNPKAKTLKYDSCCHVDELLEEPSEELDSGFPKNNEANDVSVNDEMHQTGFGDGEPHDRTEMMNAGIEAANSQEFGFQENGPCNEVRNDDTPSDSNGYGDAERDILKQKKLLLETHEFTELSTCMKCNEGGQVLGCSSCPAVVHENCLGFTASFNDSGNFFCPFCHYSRAVSEYLETKKKAFLARKELAAFFGVEIQPGHGNTEDEHNAVQCVNESTSDPQYEKVKENSKGCVNTVSKRPCMVNESGEIKVKKNSKGCVNTVSKRPCMVNESGKIRFDAGDQTQGRASTEKTIVSRETSEEENDKPYSLRVRGKEKSYACPAVPQLRRKILPWTAAEEAMLKEGVQKFSNPHDNKGFPWKLILEFGDSVFLKGRTAIDLKDKWRNLCKKGMV